MGVVTRLEPRFPDDTEASDRQIAIEKLRMFWLKRPATVLVTASQAGVPARAADPETETGSRAARKSAVRNADLVDIQASLAARMSTSSSTSRDRTAGANWPAQSSCEFDGSSPRSQEAAVAGVAVLRHDPLQFGQRGMQLVLQREERLTMMSPCRTGRSCRGRSSPSSAQSISGFQAP